MTRGVRARYLSLQQRRGILAPAISVAVATSVVYAATALRELLTAAAYGRSDELDAFLVAFMVSTFAITAVATTLPTSIIPAFIRVQHEHGDAAAHTLFSSAAALVLLKLSLISLLLWIFARPAVALLAPGFGAQKLQMVQRAYVWMLPVIMLRGIAKIYTGLLNALESFGIPAVAPVMVPGAMIVAILIGPGRLATLIFGAVFGSVLEMGLVLWAVYRMTRVPWPAFSGWTRDLRRVISQYVTLIAGALVMSGTVLVNQSMASRLGPGSVASLTYGSQVVLFFQGIVAVAVGSAVLPFMSRLAAAAEFRRVEASLFRYGWTLFALASCVSAAVAISALPVTQLLYQRGQFTAQDSREVAQVMQCYSAQIPFFIVNTLVVRVISVLEANQVLLMGALLNFVLNWLGNLWLMAYFGVRGIALSTVFVYAFTLAFSSMMAAKLLKEKQQAASFETSI